MPLPFIYTLPLNLIDDKQLVHEALDRIFDNWYLWSEKDGNFVVHSPKEAPVDLKVKLQEDGVMRKEETTEAKTETKSA